ncbi:MAG: HAD-IIA family hydrolase [Armatimonadota bacterium]|nr:HAD-IIA family hydrolase [Armatimonadota bacterium]
MPTPDPLRLAVIADIHHGAFSEAKDGPAALPLLDEAVAEINTLRPALVVDLGDRINESSPGEDAVRFREVAERFRRLQMPWVYLPGNHDLVHLSLADCEALLGVRLRPHSLDLSGWHLVFWQIDCRQQPGGRTASQADLDWLEADLRSTDLPSVVFSHVPVDDASMVGNYYFAHGVPGGPFYRNSADVRAVLERTDRAVLVVSGHVHWNSVSTIDGIRYVTVQSLTETFTTHPHPAGAWAVLHLVDHGMRLDVHGRDAATFVLPFKHRGHHWLARTPRQAPAQGAAAGSESAAATGNPDALAGVEAIILDLDGVVYSGSSLLPGVREFIGALRDSGRRVVAVTNHSGLNVSGYVEKLNRLGVDLAEDEVLTSGWATAQYLRRPDRQVRIFVLGSEGLRAELLAAGCVESDAPEFVVAGYDPGLTTARLTQAVRHVLAGARLIGTNADALLPTPDGPVPECGPVLAYLEAATGRRAEVIGKPGAFIVEQALVRLGAERGRVLIVGDTVETDVAAGVGAGIRTALVLTGNTKRPPTGDLQPTLTVPDLWTLRDLLSART